MTHSIDLSAAAAFSQLKGLTRGRILSIVVDETLVAGLEQAGQCFQPGGKKHRDGSPLRRSKQNYRFLKYHHRFFSRINCCINHVFSVHG